MIAKIRSGTIYGIDAIRVAVEVDLSRGFPKFTTVGLAEGALKESKERVRSALLNAGYEYPLARITVNLAPANVKKDESFFDLPIALGLLAASGQIKNTSLAEYLILGELSLDGRVQAVVGILPLMLEVARDTSRKVIIPKDNAAEAGIVEHLEIIPVESLAETAAILNGEREAVPYTRVAEHTAIVSAPNDFAEVRGQSLVKRALEVAAAGGHNLLMIGPPGSGKSMMAKRLPSILPPLSPAEALETNKIYSVCGLLNSNNGLMLTRPFRAPHHTISDVALVGGGRYPKPGEVSLAHNGVLFLDELGEFSKAVLEALRQPLENKTIAIARANGSAIYPASFMLVAAMNPCPCGYFGATRHACHCSEQQIRRYLQKISGPLLDRIDLQVEVPSLGFDDLLRNKTGVDSTTMRTRVLAAQNIQLRRFAESTCLRNAGMNEREFEQHCVLNAPSLQLLKNALDRFCFSGRAVNRIVKLARTIADLAAETEIGPQHLGEALQYRCLDKLYQS